MALLLSKCLCLFHPGRCGSKTCPQVLRWGCLHKVCAAPLTDFNNRIPKDPVKQTEHKQLLFKQMSLRGVQEQFMLSLVVVNNDL